MINNAINVEANVYFENYAALIQYPNILEDYENTVLGKKKREEWTGKIITI